MISTTDEKGIDPNRKYVYLMIDVTEMPTAHLVLTTTGSSKKLVAIVAATDNRKRQCWRKNGYVAISIFR